MEFSQSFNSINRSSRSKKFTYPDLVLSDIVEAVLDDEVVLDNEGVTWFAL